MTKSPECGRIFLRNELFESDYRCKFTDCDAFVPGRTDYPPLGQKNGGD